MASVVKVALLASCLRWVARFALAGPAAALAACSRRLCCAAPHQPALARPHAQRDGAKALAGDGPPIVVIYTCRNECELAAIAPLLDHTNVIALRIFYTGKAALKPCTLEPAHSLVPLSPSYDIESSAGSEGVTQPFSSTLGPAKLPRMVASRALALTVWVLTFFVAYWSLVCHCQIACVPLNGASSDSGIFRPCCGSCLTCAAFASVSGVSRLAMVLSEPCGACVRADRPGNLP